MLGDGHGGRPVFLVRLLNLVVRPPQLHQERVHVLQQTLLRVSMILTTLRCTTLRCLLVVHKQKRGITLLIMEL